MKSIRGWEIFLVFSFLTFHGFAQKEKVLIVPLKAVVDTTKMGYAALPMWPYTQRMTNNYDTSRHFRGIPASLKEMMIMEVDFQPAQGIYECYVRFAGSMPVAMLMEGLAKYNADTLQLSRRPVRHTVYLITGIDSSGKKLLGIDANNNLDFSDDKVMAYDSVFLKKDFKTILSLSPTYTVQYQYVVNGKVYDKNYNVKLAPSSSVTYADPGRERMKLVCFANEAQQGSFKKGSSQFFFTAFSRSVVRYDSAGTTVAFTEKDASSKVISNKQYVIGDTVWLNQDGYIISGISTLGDSLKLSFARKGGFVYGIDSGKIAYNIVAADLNWNKFDLQKYRGKYVLIDFWGTWCGPCVASIPDLVAISKEYKNDVQVVSIAFDQPKNMETLKEMIKSKEMNWIHVFQDFNDASKAQIVNKFKVHNFPTQILVDPNGVIILRIIGSGKGDDVRKVLAKQLGR